MHGGEKRGGIFRVFKAEKKRRNEELTFVKHGNKLFVGFHGNKNG